MMDVAVPTSMRQGLAQERIARRGWAYTAEQAEVRAVADLPEDVVVARDADAY